MGDGSKVARKRLMARLLWQAIEQGKIELPNGETIDPFKKATPAPQETTPAPGMQDSLDQMPDAPWGEGEKSNEEGNLL